MKKFFALMTLFLLSGFCLISCGDDDEEETPASNNSDSTAHKTLFAVSPEIQMQPSMTVNIYADSVQSSTVVYTWDFGDGKTDVWNGNTEYKSSYAHTYDTYGEYTITLTIKDQDETKSSKETIKIVPAPPTSIQEATKYDGDAPYSFVFKEGVLYYDVAKWEIKSVDGDNLTTVEPGIEVKAGETKDYTFEKPGLYYLYLSVSGPGVEGFKAIRTDTVLVR